LISALAQSAAIPVVGIGGIRHHNAPEVIAAGASGVGVIGAILDAVDHGAASRRLARSLEIVAGEVRGDSEGRILP
jgi:thiamine-phosphate pyrophosphorylase